MATARYSNQQGSKSRHKPSPVQPTENIGTYRRQNDVFGYELQFLLSGVLPVFQSLNYKPKRRLPDLLPNQQRPQKLYKFDSSSRRVTRRQVMRHFTGHGTDQCRNGLSNILIPYREQPRSARIVVLPTISVQSSKQDKSCSNPV